MKTIASATILAASAAILLSACGGESVPAAREGASSPSAQAAAPAIPAGLVVPAIEGPPTSVSDARAAAKVGDEITIVGLIGGRADPFVPSRAMFVLGDMALPPCTDHCATPWDYCCEPKEAITANTLTVQVTGPDGKALPLSLSGQQGLAPGKEVVVQGVVSQQAEGVLVVDAKAIALQ